MLLIPTGTDRDGGRRPLFVPLLVTGCVVAFVLVGGRPNSPGEALRKAEILNTYCLSFQSFAWWQPFTYQFLHGGWFHLLSNMFFLAAFGLVLESRLGHLGFLAIYLAGGAVAGCTQTWVGHWLDPSQGLVLGASGSTSALLGAAFALYPRAHVRGIAVPQFVPAQVSIRWMMALAIALDVVRTLLDWSGTVHSGVATLAHLGGILFGFLVGISLLASGLLVRDDADALYLIRQWLRRRQMRLALESSGTSGAGGGVAKRVRAGTHGRESEAQQALRSKIATACRARNYPLAAWHFEELLKQIPTATIPADMHLDVANELAREGQHATAATAYRNFVERFGTHPNCDDARLMLATIEWRRLHNPEAALRALDGITGRHADEQRTALADSIRTECSTALRGAEE